LLLRQQLKDFPASGGTRPFVRKHSIKSDILPGKKSVQTHGIHPMLVPHFPASHALRSRSGSLRPPTLSTGRREVTCVNEA
jgi:hypothetical protein